MNRNILLAEDEERMRKLISAYLVKDGFKVFQAENGFEALKIFKENPIHLAILDVMMPVADGWTVCNEMRKTSDIPIIMLTAKAEDEDKLLGFGLGADHYITKPFNMKLLIAVVKSLIKRVYREELDNSEELEYGVLQVDEEAYEARLNGSKLILSPKEFELLVYFRKNRGLVLTREKILDSIWGVDYYGDLRAVDTQIKRLREKLRDKSDIISTVRGVGYKFEDREV